jgi:hypothetical protein
VLCSVQQCAQPTMTGTHNAYNPAQQHSTAMDCPGQMCTPASAATAAPCLSGAPAHLKCSSAPGHCRTSNGTFQLAAGAFRRGEDALRLLPGLLLGVLHHSKQVGDALLLPQHHLRSPTRTHSACLSFELMVSRYNSHMQPSTVPLPEVAQHCQVCLGQSMARLQSAGCELLKGSTDAPWGIWNPLAHNARSRAEGQGVP